MYDDTLSSIVRHGVGQAVDLAQACRVLHRQHRQRFGVGLRNRRERKLHRPGARPRDECDRGDCKHAHRKEQHSDTALSGRRDRDAAARRELAPQNLQPFREFTGRCEAFFSGLGERALYRGIDRLRDPRLHLAELARSLGDLAPQHRFRRTAPEGRRSHQHFVEHTPERVDVGAAVDLNRSG
jgi:hypothetical protein